MRQGRDQLDHVLSSAATSRLLQPQQSGLEPVDFDASLIDPSLLSPNTRRNIALLSSTRPTTSTFRPRHGESSDGNSALGSHEGTSNLESDNRNGLNLEDIAVDSLPTAAGGESRGTNEADWLDPSLRNLNVDRSPEQRQEERGHGDQRFEEYFTQPFFLGSSSSNISSRQPDRAPSTSTRAPFTYRLQNELENGSFSAGRRHVGGEEEELESIPESESGTDSESDSPPASGSIETDLQDPNDQVKELREMDEQATEFLAANREHQQELKILMKRFELAAKRTNQLKAFVKNLSVQLLAGQEMKVFPGEDTLDPTLPWFKHFYGRDLPSNPEGTERDLYLSQTRFWPWSQAERNKLKEEVIAHNHRQIALQAAENGEDFDEKLASVDPAWYIENTEGLDWDTISLVINRRKAMDCKIQWLQHDHPSLNFKKFSKDEMKLLIDLVEDQGMDNWEEIAQKLGNGRVGWDCLKKYRNRIGQRIDWTREQDELLRDAIKNHGENWQIIARITGKHGNACINRWSKSIKPTITKGKWSPQEDEALRTAVKLVGKNWKTVAPRVSGRTDAQCRERWTNVLDPVLAKKKPWAKEEDEELLEAKANGKTWAEISRECLQGARTDNQCMRRWQDLQKPPKAKAKSKPKKGKNKRLPIDSDSEDNAEHDERLYDRSVGHATGEDVGPRGEDQPRPKKRPKRQIKQTNPELATLMVQEVEIEHGRTNAHAHDNPGTRKGTAKAGGSIRNRGDIVVDLGMFADEDALEGPRPSDTHQAVHDPGHIDERLNVDPPDDEGEQERLQRGAKGGGRGRKRKGATPASTVKSKRGGKKQ